MSIQEVFFRPYLLEDNRTNGDIAPKCKLCGTQVWTGYAQSLGHVIETIEDDRVVLIHHFFHTQCFDKKIEEQNSNGNFYYTCPAFGCGRNIKNLDKQLNIQTEKCERIGCRILLGTLALGFAYLFVSNWLASRSL